MAHRELADGHRSEASALYGSRVGGLSKGSAWGPMGVNHVLGFVKAFEHSSVLYGFMISLGLLSGVFQVFH